MNDLNTLRRYRLSGFETYTDDVTNFSIIMDLGDLLTSDLEIVYTALEHMDRILNLKVGERILIRAARDDEFSAMVVIRIE